MPYIDWDEFKDTYNTWNKTNFKSAKEFVETLYKKHNYYISPVARELGIGWGTVKTHLMHLNIYVKKSKGGNNYVNRPIGKKELSLIEANPKTLASLNRSQICERYNISDEYCKFLLRKHKFKYQKYEFKEKKS